MEDIDVSKIKIDNDKGGEEFTDAAVKESKHQDEISKNNAKVDVRSQLVSSAKLLVQATTYFIIAVGSLYLLSILFAPYCKAMCFAYDTLENLLFKVINILPWLLLFIFGDKSKLQTFIKSNDNN